MTTLSLEFMQKIALFIFAFFVVAAGIFFSFFVAWSVFVGGVVALANLWFSKEGIEQMARAVTLAATEMNTDEQKTLARSKRRGYLLKFWLRIVITGVVLFVLIRWQLVDIFGLLVGLSIIFVTAMGLSLVVAVRYLIHQNRGRR